MKLSFNTYIDDTWISFLNKNFKWSVALILRTLTICIIIFIIIKTLQYSGIATMLPFSSSSSENVIPGPTENVSLPSKNNYTEDIKEINETQKLLKNKNNEISE